MDSRGRDNVRKYALASALGPRFEPARGAHFGHPCKEKPAMASRAQVARSRNAPSGLRDVARYDRLPVVQALSGVAKELGSGWVLETR